MKWHATRDYAPQFGRLGGHSAIGPDGAGVLGIAAYANVPTKPTNSSNALSERFIVFLLGYTEADWEKLASAGTHYTYPCKPLINRVLSANIGVGEHLSRRAGVQWPEGSRPFTYIRVLVKSIV